MQLLSLGMVCAGLALLLISFNLVRHDRHFDRIDTRLTTLETIRVVRPAPQVVDTIPVIIRLPDDVLRWE